MQEPGLHQERRQERLKPAMKFLRTWMGDIGYFRKPASGQNLGRIERAKGNEVAAVIHFPVTGLRRPARSGHFGEKRVMRQFASEAGNRAQWKNQSARGRLIASDRPSAPTAF
jgi:hypothetical protein